MVEPDQMVACGADAGVFVRLCVGWILELDEFVERCGDRLERAGSGTTAVD